MHQKFIIAKTLKVTKKIEHLLLILDYYLRMQSLIS